MTYVIVYTKEKGRLELTEQEYDMGSSIETLHREDGPAVEWTSDGNTHWYKDGFLHREDGPAVEEENRGYRVWYMNGIMHREDGPALEYSSGFLHWYLDGKQYSKEGFNEIIKEIDSLDLALGLTDPREWVRNRWKKMIQKKD